jgi:hypothetical protein
MYSLKKLKFKAFKIHKLLNSNSGPVHTLNSKNKFQLQSEKSGFKIFSTHNVLYSDPIWPTVESKTQNPSTVFSNLDSNV